MKKSVYHTSWKFRLCVGCGLCELVCPVAAVRVGENRIGDPRPFVDFQKCLDCGLCSEYCPFTRSELEKQLELVSRAKDANSFGLEGSDFFLAFDKSAGRKRSASGGVVSSWVNQLLKSEKINGVIHGQPVAAKAGEPHFEAVFSETAEQVNDRRSSFYAPLNFSTVVRENCRGKRKKFVMLGTPCVVRGYARLFSRHPDYSKNRVFFIGLVCSHNVSHRFSDFMVDSLGIDRITQVSLNYRCKTDIPDANHFKIHAADSAGETLGETDRLKGDFTFFWRNYSFALNPCHYCPDFWAREADMAVKDAWGSWSVDPGGTGIVIIRHEQWKKEFPQAKDLFYFEPLTFSTVAACQNPTSMYKQAGAVTRWKRSLLFPENIRSGFSRYRLISGFSKNVYRLMGYRACKWLVRVFDQALIVFPEISRRMFRAVKRMLKVILFPLYPVQWVKRFVGFQQKNRKPVILMVGGYGYQNAGDEAQLGATCMRLGELFPGYLIKVLTPDPEMTFRLHGCAVGEAPRLAFFDADLSNLYLLKSRKDKIRFLGRSAWIYGNALLMRCGLNPVKLNPRRSVLLHEIRSAAMVYFCGGGYLTGKTLSRLWDGALLGRLAYLFKVPVALSGQTMGVWGSRLNRIITRWGFARAKLISLRDPESSPAALREIGITGDQVMVTHDDALFCQSVRDDERIGDYLQEAGLKKSEYHCGYLVFHFHYWGVRGNSQKNRLLENIHSLVDWSFNTFKLKILLLGMTPSDDTPLGDFFRRYLHPGVIRLPQNYDYSLIRGIIGRATACVSMKHHPLIFSLGEGVPALSLSLSEYYAHKNRGALKLCGMEHFNVNLEHDDCLTDFKVKLQTIINHREKLSREIIRSHQRLHLNRREFDHKLQALLSERNIKR